MLPNDRPLTIAEAADLIRDGKLSPVGLVEDCLRRIDALDGTYHAFIEVLREPALAAARAAEAEIAAGRWRGPMHGVPIGLKDIYETKGVRTTGHSRVAADYVPTEDATTTAMLEASGAINLGKLATWEFAIGGPSFDLPWPPAGNPWRHDHDPGGSSSGTGTAVATGMVLGGMGSDTGGSIRFPAALCGIAGIKPTYGRVSRAGVMPLSFSLDHAGPMAWTVEDCAIMMQALAGHDPRDPASAELPVPDYRAALTGDAKGLRVGVLRQFYETDAPADADCAAAFDAALAALADLGATVVELPALSPMQDYLAAAFLISRSEAFAIHEETLRASPGLYGEVARERMLMGALVTGADYVQAMRRRRELCVEFAAAMRGVDVVALPTLPTAAPKLGAYGKHFTIDRPLYTTPFNLTGSPALSVCDGFSAEGLPFGLQIVGHPFDEATVMRVGDAYEKATQWRGMRPEPLAMAAE
ncbi:amidase [Rubrimonas cliftonensis]|uniref:Aspartyl-tRNA(Asn)/glutamyl-tRNA(Gln) amidotransferase subunit A n=1 Tax=Rubrimonas cliftonensis TaxID=89524 RepID=A0A1H4ATU2_9RHOB|nr:amidase [Rubrimonas cliftonensis]SEA39300.1 aspartyl-tRNA(Asn)/glutamyl-tRNA(Gln) amidotransferase subunit A [Rubrimonas cliftonensis]